MAKLRQATPPEQIYWKREFTGQFIVSVPPYRWAQYREMIQHIHEKHGAAALWWASDRDVQVLMVRGNVQDVAQFDLADDEFWQRVEDFERYGQERPAS